MKRGIIKISDILYKEDWSIISEIFKDFRPTHIEFRHWENDIWYLFGESEMFDEVKEGEKVPEYTVIFTFTSHPDKTYTFKFQKVV
jgi:hypothetical protein